MSDLKTFPDTEAAVLELLADFAEQLGTVTPADLQDVVPYIRVQRYGGGDDHITDAARVDVDVFAANRAAAWTLSATVHQRMLSFPHVLSNCVIDYVATDIGPRELPWGDPEVRRFTASYQVSARRPQ